jgi:hypothetical protein
MEALKRCFEHGVELFDIHKGEAFLFAPTISSISGSTVPG